MQVLYV